jgi:hypothetical protein
LGVGGALGSLLVEDFFAVAHVFIRVFGVPQTRRLIILLRLGI